MARAERDAGAHRPKASPSGADPLPVLDLESPALIKIVGTLVVFKPVTAHLELTQALLPAMHLFAEPSPPAPNLLVDAPLNIRCPRQRKLDAELVQTH